jgi:EAL domain-containing protein (putative c-di-GMP-specific phosphodiesterase class I)
VVWLDDFGSGYSSLNVLKDFRFDLLKIDMVFLKGFAGNNNSKSIIKNIIDLANTLHMETLTEGVESEDAVEFLKEAGCKRMQGYYYGKPQPYEELLEKIKDGTYELLDEIVNK